MNPTQFKSILSLLIPHVIRQIVAERNLSETEAIKLFYSSETYELLSDEESKLWYFTPENLFNWLKEEKRWA